MHAVSFQERLSRVLAARVAEQQRQQRPQYQRARAALVALSGALVMFFLLKGATLAYFGAADFAAITAPLAQGESFATLRLWFAGADPLTRVLALVMNPSGAGV